METKYCTYNCFLLFANEKEINEEVFLHAEDFIYLNLRRNYDSLRWSAFANYATKCHIVLRFKKENNLPQTIKLGEAVCKNELVNFRKDEKHHSSKCNCGSTYMQFDPLRNKKWLRRL